MYVGFMIKKQIEKQIKYVFEKKYGIKARGEVVSRSEYFSDYASNIALIYSKEIGRKPKDIACEIKEELLKKKHPLIDGIEIAGPGFINIQISCSAILGEVSRVREALDFGMENNKGSNINIEFISANPTGDLHIGHGRGAFFGDVLARILVFTGAKVKREFYINNSKESGQIKELGKTALGVGTKYFTDSLSLKIEKQKTQTEDIIKNINSEYEKYKEAGFLLAKEIQKYNKFFIEKDLGICFDEWYSEYDQISKTKKDEKILGLLREKDLVYFNDGAEWLRTSAYGDDEDRVVVRSDGTKSYFLSDIAYHNEKFSRGDNLVINVWGADHQGHIKKMQAVKKMLNWSGLFSIFITQLVSLRDGGEVKKMSKREGNVVLLKDVVDEFGIDVVRWFYNEKSLNTHMEFDSELAREQSQKNPVFYVQYAHARIVSIEQSAVGCNLDGSDMESVVLQKEGRALAAKLVEFSEIVVEISHNHQVHKLTTYTYELATEFNRFYRDIRVINGDNVNSGALTLIRIVRRVLAESLGLLGISAPKKM